MINNFEYYTPTRIIFGRGTESRVGEQVRANDGHSVMIVYGSERVRKNGVMDRITASLEAEGISYELLGGVVPNPHLSLVYEGIEKGKKSGADFVLAVGGGSAIDTAKAIGYGLYEPDEDVWDLFDFKRKSKGAVPVGVVLTIAAAGSEMSMSCVITNEKTGEKRGYNSDAARPRFAILDPELTLSLPDFQTMCGCADMMMHTMERYFTNGGNMEITDRIAEGLMVTVMNNTYKLHKNPSDYEARAEVMWAGSLAHNDLTGCGNAGNDFATHKLEHELGGMYDVTHGAGLTALWGSWARYVVADCLPRFVRFAAEVHHVQPGKDDMETALRGIEAQEEFYRAIKLPTSLKELGVSPTDEEMREMARRCAIATGNKLGSAKVLHEEDMYLIYKAANER